ncbi:MAG: 3-deoxy-7-phosphoheptulonate synthase class II [Balneolales bacterium]
MKTASKTETWSPTSWQQHPINQLPEYADQNKLERIYQELKSYPPLITSWEVEDLKSKLAAASRGEAFLIQGGDCAETFDSCNSPQIVGLIKVLLQTSFILIHEMGIPVIRVGRIAGQYAKPRSNNLERIGELELPTYRGDLINGFDADGEARQPDASRLLEGYHKSAMTLNFIRSLTEGGGFADLHHPEFWELDFMRKNKYYKEYETMVKSITNAVRFVESISESSMPMLQRVQMFTSHEALNLYYDSAQTRKVPHHQGWYNLSTHMPWLGNRTRDINGAHVEYFKGIENPVGLKVGPPYDIDEVIKLIDLINPNHIEGKVTIITRMGKGNVDQYLPELIQRVKAAGNSVVWSCDPMHGNTFSTDDKIKTRNFDDILDEIKQTFAIHRSEGTNLGGVHLELTGDNVTECIGGAKGLNAAGLKTNYKSYCDPRLNYQQSLEMAFLIAREWKKSKEVQKA